MNLYEAELLAKSLMRKHGLTFWFFEYKDMVKTFGLCSGRNNTIYLSRQLVRLNDVAEVTDVILHEIAHALVGNSHGHDRVWKAKCREIGARPERCYTSDNVEVPELRYQAVCGGCGKKHQRTRKPDTTRMSSCFCQSGPWDKRILLKYVDTFARVRI